MDHGGLTKHLKAGLVEVSALENWQYMAILSVYASLRR